MEITISYTELGTVLAPILGSVVALEESRVRWERELQNCRKMLLRMRRMAGDHPVQPKVQVFSVLFQRSIPATSRLRSWAAITQHPEPAAFRCGRKHGKVSETRPSVLLWMLSDQDCHTLLGLERKHRGLGSCPAESPGRTPSRLDRSLDFHKQPANFESSVYVLK